MIVDWIIEFIFLLDLIHEFFLVYKDENNIKVKSHSKIARRYIFKGSFIFDLAALIPIFKVIFDDRLWLLVKMTRLYRIRKIS